MKEIIRFCVERRVTVTMCTVAVFIFGILAWIRLDRAYMPELEFPELNVLTSYPNASSQEVENLITKVIEESAGTVKNVHRIHSSSREGISVVTVEFMWGTNMDMASLNLREKVDLAKAKLPRDAGEPRIERFNPFALPVITLSLSGPLSEQDLLTLARRPVAELLEKTKGVAAVSITGGREREILVELDQSKLSSRSLPILDVGQAISRANITYPAGSVKDERYEYLVRVLGTFESVSDLERIAVAVDREKLSTALSPQDTRRQRRVGPNPRNVPQPIELGNLGAVHDTLAEITSHSRYDGQPNIAISVLKQAEANIVRVADTIRHKLPDIESKLPKGVSLTVVYDQSVFVKSGIRGMIANGLMGGVLAFLVLLLFMGNVKDASIVSLAIPVSVMAALFVLLANGMNLNTITLAGIVIGLGQLVDGAIVVQENIHRHRKNGKPPNEAAVDGAYEVFGAVWSSVLTTVAVFLPLVFVVGIVGQVFNDLSWSVIFVLLSSLVVSFTLIPMLAATWGSGLTISHPVFSSWQTRFNKWTEAYASILSYALNHPGRIIGLTLAGCLFSLSLLYFIPKSVFPYVDSKQILLELEMPMGTTLEATNKAALLVESILKEQDLIQHHAVTVGSLSQDGLQPLGNHQARIVADIRPGRFTSTPRVIKILEEDVKTLDLKGGRLTIHEQGSTFSIFGAGGAPVVVEIKGHNLAKLESLSKILNGRLESVKGLTNVRSTLAKPAPEIQMDVKRDALADSSLSVFDLAETVLAGVRGKVVSKFRDEGKEIDIRMRLRKEDRENIRSVESLLVQSPLGFPVPLRSMAFIRLGSGPSEIKRFDQERTVQILADLSNRSLANAEKDILPILQELQEPGVSVTLTGETARIAESFTSLKIVFMLSILFVFMIMAAKFENLWQPLLILFTIPLALIGLAPALFLTWNHLTVMAGMGVVLLAGIVVNNGIVLIDFVNQLRAEGVPMRDAWKKGCLIRLRPILMTALTTILGMLPLALGIGEGADMQAPMAIVVVAGLMVSSILTLLVLPTLAVVAEEKIFNPGVRHALVSKWKTWGFFSRQRFIPDHKVTD